MIKAVLFDYGGVLTQSGKSGFIRDSVARLYHVDPHDVHIGEEHAKLRRGLMSDDDFFAALNRQYGKVVTKEMFIKETAGSLTPTPEVYDLAQRMRGHGIQTAIFSNIFAMNATELRRQGQYDGFDPVILSCDVHYAKPDPEFYEYAINALGVLPQEILLIDDQEKCLGPAHKLGMKVLAAVSPAQIIADAEAIVFTENGIHL